MKQIIFARLLINYSKNRDQGITLTELLVGLVVSGIILTAAANAFINLLDANQEIESKTNRRNTLIRALEYIQEDMKGAKSITQEALGGNCASGSISSDECLVITYPDDTDIDGIGCTGVAPKIYYGYLNIRGGTQIWLKPGTLRRKVICANTSGNWTVIADGLISISENDPTIGFNTPNGVSNNGDFCSQNDVNWTGDDTVYGANSNGKGGFRFCLDSNTPTNRLARIFLYGHLVGSVANAQVSLSTLSFARAN